MNQNIKQYIYPVFLTLALIAFAVNFPNLFSYWNLRYLIWLLPPLVFASEIMMPVLPKSITAQRFLSFRLGYWLYCFIALLSMLLEQWLSGILSGYFNLAAVLPYSDAISYYEGARQFAIDGEIRGVAAWKPLSTAYYGVLLDMFNFDARFPLIFTALAACASVYWVGLYIQKLFGYGAAFLYAAFSLSYFSPLSTSYMTESLGFIVGNLAFYFTLYALHSRHRLIIAIFSLFLWVLALNVRPGEMFILPALVIFFLGYVFNVFSNKEKLLRYSLIFTGILVLSFGICRLFSSFITDKNSQNNGSFAYVMYALSAGAEAKNWTQIRKDHPEVLNLKKGKEVNFVYNKTWNNLRSNPFLFIKAVTVSVFMPFFKPVKTLIGKVRGFEFLFHYKIYHLLFFASWLLIILGLLRRMTLPDCYRPYLWLCVYTAAAAILSYPFLPSDNRILSPVIGAHYFWLCAGAGIALYWLKNRFASKNVDTAANSDALLIAAADIPHRQVVVSSGALVLLLLLCPIITGLIPPPVYNTKSIFANCQCPTQPLAFNLNDYNFAVFDDNQLYPFIPYVSSQYFLSSNYAKKLRKDGLKVNDGQSYVQGAPIGEKKMYRFVLNKAIPIQKEYIVVCPRGEITGRFFQGDIIKSGNF
ncbi:MAG: hypothetical protein IPL35_06760 [Sphingobacteriales bacterium]|nr:hypothetical protein [Sphingobacteriales bacterium]